MKFMNYLGVLIAGCCLCALAHAGPPAPTEVLPGVWRFRIGEPEAITPASTRHYLPATDALRELPPVPQCPIAIASDLSDRGVLIHVPVLPDEQIYGLGLQLQSFQQRGAKKMLRVNADPAVDTGDSHAPVPFYVTTRGYGVFVDTARYATFYLGNKIRPPDATPGNPPYDVGPSSEVEVEVPRARGVDVYVFAGPSLREAVQRYNLFSGGGPIPPRWGLGFWYRCETDFAQDDVLTLAKEFRDRRIPCDVLGLEPHWQSHAYSCSYLWSDKFPDPAAMAAALRRQHFRLNLWEHAFVHPSSPIYGDLLPHSGDHKVWGGLVPDFISEEARRIFGDLHEKTHVALGVSGYKADECDNSDFKGNWSFPEISRFPSGADGEQMHSLFGLRYQDALLGAFERRRERTYGLVRSSGALAAPYPFVLYSDLYDHRQFIHAVAQSGFSGLLWTPEVRDSSGGSAELVRRLQASAFSPLAIINAWYLKNPPWKQVDRAANNAGHFTPGWEKTEAQCRAIIELRMRFVPYLQAAFVRYHREGLPPFRALVMDYPDDPQAAGIDDEYLMGDSLLVAPIIVPARPSNQPDDVPPAMSPEGLRSVYLPIGTWYDFWTGEKLAGGRRFDIKVSLDRIPLYVKSGAILPLAAATLDTDDSASWRLTARVFGDGRDGARLYEDNGGFAPSLPEVRLEWDAEKQAGQVTRLAGEPPSAEDPHYSVIEWIH